MESAFKFAQENLGEYKPPVEYNHEQPIFDDDGKVTERTRSGLENILSAYSGIANLHAANTDNNVENYKIDEVYVVGSGSRGVNDSDLDLMLIAPDLDQQSADNIKVMLSFLYFSHKPKQEAIDVFIRQEDRYPSRSSTEITGQVEDLLKKYRHGTRNIANL